MRFHTQQDEEALFTARALDRSTLTSYIIGSKRQHLQQPFSARTALIAAAVDSSINSRRNMHHLKQESHYSSALNCH
ncbi:MAG: hypothetical protein ACK51L_03420 [bacterium]